MKLDRRLWLEAWRERLDLALTLGLGFLAGGILVAQAWLLSWVISQVTLHGSGLGDVLVPLLALLALALTRACLVWGSEVTSGRLAVRVKEDLRERLVAHLMDLGPAYTHGERTGELSSTVWEGIEALDAYFRSYLPQLVLAALVPLFIVLVVFPVDWVSGLVMLLTAPLIPVFMLLIGNAAEALTRRQWRSLSRMSAHFLDVLQGLSTLKLFGRSREQIQIIASISERFRHTTMGVLRVAFLSALVLEMVGTLSTAVIAVQVGLRLLYGRLALEQALFVLVLAPEFYLPLRMLGARFHAGMAGVAAARRIFEILDIESPARRVASTLPEKAQPLQHPQRLQFTDVHYAYESGDRPALHGLSFTLEPGETVALVGPSGAGKSTVAALLLRFIEPDSGEISVGDLPLRRVALSAWRAQVGWVPQIPHLFYGSVADNIRLGAPSAPDDRMVEAARRARAHGFIEALPQGYDTLIGEQGSRLSGGEAQRIALARAFVKDAPLVILDEATANLDPETDNMLQEAFLELLDGSRERMAIVIAHRMGTLRAVDRILVLDGGRIVETGDHETLLRRDGLYRRLVLAYGTGPAELSGSAQTREVGPQLEPHEGRQTSPFQFATQATTLERATATRESARASDGPKAGVLGRLLRLASPLAAWMLAATLLGAATIASSIGLMATSAYIIAKAAFHPSIAELQVAIVGVRFFGVARGVLRYLERIVSHQATFRLLARIRVWFYEALEPLAPGRLMLYTSGEIHARIVADVDVLQDFYLRVLAPPLVALLITLLATLFLGYFDLHLAAVLLAFLVLTGVGVPLLVRGLSRLPSQHLIDARARFKATMVDLTQGIADLLAYDQEGFLQGRFRTLRREIADLQSRLARVGGLHATLTGLLMNLATVAILAVAIPLVGTGRLDSVHLAVLCLAVIASFEAVAPLPLAFQHLDGSLEAGRRLFEIIDAEPVVREPRAPAPIPPDLSICVQDLGFAYESGGTPVLEGITFELNQGKKLAIVGPSGAGKSTLLRLLLRFCEFKDGQISVGGQDLRDLPAELWRQMVSVVSQRTFLFNATVRENLLLARPSASAVEIQRAAQLARIHKFIVSLPNGYETWIGEQGMRLSGGERQRLAIARAILADAPILFLDEPTANLDAITEREILAALQTISEQRTVLTVTHRLAGLEEMDEILVLRAGRIVERGRHRELMQRGGLYNRMWQLQMQGWL